MFKAAQGADINTVTEQVGEGDFPERQPTFDPESPYAFMPPAYDTLPKDPPKYCDIYENPAFEDDTSCDVALPPPLQDASGAANSDPGQEHTYSLAENPRLEPAARDPPPPRYEGIHDTVPMPEVSINSQRCVSDPSVVSSNSDNSGGQGESGILSCTSSFSIITVSSISNSDVEDAETAQGPTVSTDDATAHQTTTRSEPELQQDAGSVSNTLSDRDHGSNR